MREEINNLLKWYLKDFSDDFTNGFKQLFIDAFIVNENERK